MNCPYIFREGDKLVVSGKKEIGEVCGLRFGRKEYGGYCPGHARLMGTMPEEALKKEQERRAATKEEQRERKEIATENVVKATESVGGENPRLNASVLDAMGLKDPCDLQTVYDEFMAVPNKPSATYESHNEKMAFARWLESPVHLRTPKTMEGAAKILGVTTKTLFVWKSLPEVIDFINMDTEKRALGMFPLAMYKLGVNIDRGDVKSIQTLMEYCEKKSIENNKKKKGMNIPIEMLEVANDFARSTMVKKNSGPALAAEKNMVLTDHFNESMIAGKEN
jgi:hypothetical protein